MVEPWANNGYECYCFDIQKTDKSKKNIHFICEDLRTLEPGQFLKSIDKKKEDVKAVFAFPPCDHLAASGSRWFKGKGLRKLAESIELFAVATEWCNYFEAPYMIENPVSTISTYWREPDHTFHPYQYVGLCEDDNYTKKTCLWTGNNFIMPKAVPSFKKQSLDTNQKCEGQQSFLDQSNLPDNRIHACPPGEGRKNFRSATPMGFATAVYNENSK